MTRDWVTSPSPRDVYGPDLEGERPWWADDAESSFVEYPGAAPVIVEYPQPCQCQCKCTNLATVGSYCENCTPEPRFT